MNGDLIVNKNYSITEDCYNDYAEYRGIECIYNIVENQEIPDDLIKEIDKSYRYILEQYRGKIPASDEVLSLLNDWLWERCKEQAFIDQRLNSIYEDTGEEDDDYYAVFEYFEMLDYGGTVLQFDSICYYILEDILGYTFISEDDNGEQVIKNDAQIDIFCLISANQGGELCLIN